MNVNESHLSMEGTWKLLAFPDYIFERQIDSKSEPNSRSGSFKRNNSSINFHDEEKRRHSLPCSTANVNSTFSNDLSDHKRGFPKRVRSFKTSSKGIATATEGDRRESHVNINSLQESYRKSLSSENSEDSAISFGGSSTCSNDYFRICVMGADTVGKRTLLRQFMCSELMCSNVFDVGDVEDNMVSVVLDNDESTLEFVDFSEYVDDRFPVDAYIVVFSVHERPTYDVAILYLQYVRDELDSDRPIILVANKVDLVRKRQVTAEEAKEMAAKYDCKYIETSATLNVKVDQLLVGVLKQIKLKLNPDVEETTERAAKETCTTGAKDFLNRILHIKSKDKHNHDEVLVI